MIYLLFWGFIFILLLFLAGAGLKSLPAELRVMVGLNQVGLKLN